MAKMVVAPEQFVDMAFPLGGNDAQNEFWRQADLTTVKGVNVRGEEPVGQNMRGGQREGLSRFIPQRVNGISLIQHLNVVVDPQAAGLNADDDTQPPGSGYIPDPSTNNLSDRNPPGRFVPPRGSGRPPNRHIPSSSSSITLIQSKVVSDHDATGTVSLVFEAPTTSGNLLVVFAVTHDPSHTGVPRAGNVRTGSSGAYTQVGGGAYYSEVDGVNISPASHSLSAWYLVSDGSSGTQTVQVDLGGMCNYAISALEYHGTALVGPLDTNDRWSHLDGTIGPLNTTQITGNAVSPGGTGELVLGAFTGEFAFFPGAAAGANSFRLVLDNINFASGQVVDRTSVSSPSTATPKVTFNAVDVSPSETASFCGIAVVFKKAP